MENVAGEIQVLRLTLAVSRIVMESGEEVRRLTTVMSVQAEVRV